MICQWGLTLILPGGQAYIISHKIYSLNFGYVWLRCELTELERHFSRKICSREGNSSRAYIIFIFSDWTYPKIIFEIQNFQKFSFFHSRPGAYLTDDPLTWFFDLNWTSYLFNWQYSTNCRRTRAFVDRYLTVTPDFEHFCTVSGKIISNGFEDLITILE